MTALFSPTLGPRPKSLRVTVENDCLLDATDAKNPVVKNMKTGKIYLIPAPDAEGVAWLKAYEAEQATAKAAKVPAPSGGNVTYGIWGGFTNIVSAFDSYMWVPPPAPGNPGDILYYWIGINGSGGALLQPVLQAIQSSVWELQSYYVIGSGVVAESPPSSPQTGGTQVQAMIANNNNGTWTSSFVGHPAPTLTVATSAFTASATALEAALELYGPITDIWPVGSVPPASPNSFVFQWLAMIDVTGAHPTPNWTLYEAYPSNSVPSITTPNTPPYTWRRDIWLLNTA